MKSLIPLLSLFVIPFGFLCSQTTTDLNEGTQLTHDSVNDTWSFSWWGRSGRTYFIQQSDELMSWQYIPIIEPGQDAVIEWGFNTNADKLFMRLKHTDLPTSDPWNDDFDGDGISNMDELTAPAELNLDPFDPDSNDNGIPDGLEDEDTDMLPDWWEIYWFSNLDQTADQDADSDFILNGSEFFVGTNPTIGQERFLVLESWPSESTVNSDGILEPGVSLQVLGALGFPISNAHLELAIESGPFEFPGEAVAPAQTITQITDATGRLAVDVRLNDFYTGTGSIRLTAGLDENAPSLTLPISVVPGVPPAEPVSVTVAAPTGDTGFVSWQESPDAAIKEIRYEVYRNGEVVGITTDLQFTDSLPVGWQTAIYEVVAIDHTGARSEVSSSVVLRALPTGGIAEASGLYLVEESGMQATVAWLPGASGYGIIGYHVELDGQIVATSPDNRWTFTNLSPETTYTLAVYAVDQRGQLSAVSENLQFTTGVASALQIRAGGAQAYLFEPGGPLSGWGDNTLNALGAHYPNDPVSREVSQRVPVSASLHPQTVEMASGRYSAIIQSSEGLISQVGAYQLESGSQLQSFYHLPELSGITIEGIGAGDFHFMGVEVGTGSVYAWGVNDYRQLGYSTAGAFESIVPQAVVLGSGEPLTGAVEVYGGTDFSLARMADGTLRSWGLKSRLGHPDNSGNSNEWDHPLPVLKTNAQPLDNIVAVATGVSHSLALDSNGEVWSFGNNGALQLGQIQNSGESDEEFLGNHLVPERVNVNANSWPILGDIIQIAAGAFHSMALDSQGDVWCWGYSEHGQLGLPNNFPVTMPVAQKVPALDEVNILSIAAGEQSSYAYADDGTVWAWGRNQKGQLGDGTTTDRQTPVRVLVGSEHITFTPYRSAPDGESGVFISAARLGASIRYTLDGSIVSENSPIAVPGVVLNPLPGTVIRARAYAGNVSIGEEHRWRMPTVLNGDAGNGIVGHVNASGQLSVWGKSSDYVPGRATGVGHFLNELEETTTRKINISGESLQAFTYEGELFGWGDNAEGQLLSGGASRLIQPTLEPQLTGKPILASALSSLSGSGYGGAHRIIWCDDLITTGINAKGQLGLTEGASETRHFGQIEVPVTQHPIEGIAAGTGVSFIHDTMGNTWVLGDHRLSGYSRAANADYLVNGASAFYRAAVSNLTQVSSGITKLAGLRGDGTVWNWGLDLEQSALLLPNQVYAEFAPNEEGPLEDIIEIAYGHNHGLALRADGTVWSWGNSFEGALGYDVEYPNDSLARQVPGLTNIHWIAAGNETSFAGSTDGTIWGWGRNIYGELGDATLPGGSSPVAITIPSAPAPETSPADTDSSEDPYENYVLPILSNPDTEPAIGPQIFIETPSDLKLAD